MYLIFLMIPVVLLGPRCWSTEGCGQEGSVTWGVVNLRDRDAGWHGSQLYERLSLQPKAASSTGPGTELLLNEMPLCVCYNWYGCLSVLFRQETKWGIKELSRISQNMHKKEINVLKYVALKAAKIFFKFPYITFTHTPNVNILLYLPFILSLSKYICVCIYVYIYVFFFKKKLWE